MLGRQHHIPGACVVKDAGPLFRLPLHALLVEHRSKIVIVIVSAVVLAMVSLGGRTVDTQHVQVPLGIRVVLDVVDVAEVMFRVRQRSPPRNRIQTPMDKNSQLGVGIPLRQRVLVERLKSRLILFCDLSLGRRSQQPEQQSFEQIHSRFPYTYRSTYSCTGMRSSCCWLSETSRMACCFCGVNRRARLVRNFASKSGMPSLLRLRWPSGYSTVSVKLLPSRKEMVSELAIERFSGSW